MARAGTYHATIHRGRDWYPVITIKSKSTGLPIDLTDCHAYVEGFSDEWETSLFILTDALGTVTMGGAAGTVQPLLADTESLGYDAGRGKLLIDITWSDGKRLALLVGNLFISDEAPTS